MHPKIQKQYTDSSEEQDSVPIQFSERPHSEYSVLPEQPWTKMAGLFFSIAVAIVYWSPLSDVTLLTESGAGLEQSISGWNNKSQQKYSLGSKYFVASFLPKAFLFLGAKGKLAWLHCFCTGVIIRVPVKAIFFSTRQWIPRWKRDAIRTKTFIDIRCLSPIRACYPWQQNDSFVTHP